MGEISGNYDKDCFCDAYSLPHHDVPLKLGTEENLRGYGNIVHDFNTEKVEIVPWPTSGKWPLLAGTGVGGGIMEGDFLFRYDDGYIIADNIAAGELGEGFVTGRLLEGQKDVRSGTHVLVRDTNYHPDGGQVFYPKTKRPFVMLLSKAGDDITIDDFEAFYFDGSCGFNIAPGVWHQSPYPVEDKEMTFMNKQGAVFACVTIDTVQSHNKYLKVPLRM